ncbi:MAG: peptide ABC transporter substrate-binding protein [Anaerolineales bacterium]|nr:peptide ABC transporter substrate-binding protein [Anaerolineales bacterium]
MYNKRWFNVLCVSMLVLLSVALASCARLTSTPAGGETPVVTEEAQKSSVVIVIPEDPPNFNAAVYDTGYDALVMELVLLGLTDLNPNGEVITELAAELPSTENGSVVIDEENWTMDVTWKLRQDVKWQDGQPVTADDLVFTYEAIVNPETGGWIPGVDYIDSVEKVDQYTVVVHYNSIYPGYLLQFGGEQVVLWPAHYCNAEEGFIAWDCARQPLSNGPYILEEWTVGDHMNFVRNPGYYQPGKPTIERIVVRIIPDDAVRKTMLIQGDADIYPWVTEPVATDLIQQASLVTVSVSPTSRWVMRLFPNLAARGTIDSVETPHPILADVRVRQAIRMAIDVPQISDSIFYGYSKPVWSEFFRPPYDTCNIPQPVYDPAAAAALLEEAGWRDTDGDEVRECHGCLYAEEGYVMEMEMITYSEYGEALVLTQQLISEMLGKIGMHLRLTVMEGSVMWADFASGGIEQRGNFDIDLYDDGYAGSDPTDFLWQYYAADAAIPDYGWNIGRWYNEDFNALLDEAYTLDEAYRQEVFCQMAEILDEEVPQILLFTTINADAFSNRLNGPQATANDMVTWNVADWTIVSP